MTEIPLMLIHNRQNKQLGFTIVELLVVVVVIGILAALVIVGYSGITRNAANAVVKDTLRSAGTAMEKVNIELSSYPAAIPGSVKPSQNIGLALATVTDPKTFCINGTYSGNNSIAWHITQSQQVETGLCSGAVIAGTEVGTYNPSAGGATPAAVVSSAVTVNGSGGGFKLTTDEAWSNITVAWNAVPNATRYEVHTRLSTTATWYGRDLANGTSQYSDTYSGAAATSLYISPSSTSLTWTSASAVPRTAGQTFEYRYRSYVGGVASEWFTASISAPSTDTMATVQNFTATPDISWTSVALNWAAPTGFGTPSNITYDLQTRLSNTATWYYRDLTNGSSQYSAGYTGATPVTEFIPLSTTSLNWSSSSAIPRTSGAVYEYRIRFKSVSSPNTIYGPWSTVSLTVPTDASLQAMSSFSVVPDGTYASIGLSWAGPAGLGNPSNITYDLQSRLSTTATWYYRALADGSSQYSAGYTGATPVTEFIPLSTTSLNWTTRPASGATHEFRMRIRSTTASGIYGPWSTVTLTRP